MEIERLATTEVFRDLDSNALEALLSRGTVRELADGETLFRIGEPDRNRLYILYDGRVALTDADGAVTTDSALAILGLSSYFDDKPYTLTASAVGPCRIIEVPLETVRELEEEHPVLADALSRAIAERIRAGSQSRASAGGVLAQPVRAYMNSPLATCGSGTTLKEAFEEMERGGMGSLGVLDEAGGLIGLASVRTIARAMLADGHGAGASVVVAAQPVVPMPPDGQLRDAQELQARHGVKYVVVMDGTRPVGILSQTNILQAVMLQQTLLRDRIRRTASFAELRDLAADVAAVAREAWESNREASRAAYLISEYHIHLQRRCVEMVLDELEDEGHGPAPRAYALLLLGSLGRWESLLNPDQDNAIIIDDAPDAEGAPRPLSEEENRWFEVFTDRVNVRLDEIGYEWCKGDIMARNPEYRRLLSEWCRRIDWMSRHPNAKIARWANIFFDFSLLHGEDRLVNQLWAHSIDCLQRRPRLLRFMTQDDAEGEPALGWFNRLVTSDREEARGRIDIKRNGLRILCNAARIYSLSAGVRETSTVARFRALQRQGVLTAEMVDAVIAAHEELLDLLLAHQLEQREAGRPLDKYIDPEGLDDLAYQSLVTSMRAVRRLQQQLHGQYGL